ncbi:MAG TPA: Gfo/Idh/MocA family oxidoreductase [Candidatus Dormibacteraeota bacterium]|nr:Gfo/Idh/MocA family oxidoreductase [Candidatus Dormibacteraeota bacterium]
MTEPPLRWGVLGAADIARKAVIPAIAAAGGEVVALASRDPDRGQEVAQSLGIPQFLRKYQELVEADLDAVYIPLPNSLHLPWTLQAVAAGKHVLCEKPLALSAAEARQMRQAAEERSVVLAEAVMYRYHPRWQQVRQLISDGAVGNLRHLQGSFTFSLGPRPDIRWDRELGGGALYDVGSYLVSACRWLVGEPIRVLARADMRQGVDGDGSMLLEFAGSDGPVAAELAYSFESAETQRLELIGSKGSLLVPKPFTAWTGESIPIWLSREPGGPAEQIATPAADPYQEMVAAFTSRVRGGPLLSTGPEDAELGLRVLDAARRSLASRSWELPLG